MSDRKVYTEDEQREAESLLKQLLRYKLCVEHGLKSTFNMRNNYEQEYERLWRILGYKNGVKVS